MQDNIKGDLLETVKNNFIDKDDYLEVGNLSAGLILNQSKGTNVYRVLKMELATCKSFTFAVAFINQQGLASLKTVLHDLYKRGIKGRILTSTYLYFNKPAIFRDLLEVQNAEIRLFNERNDNDEVLPFHAKGYLFDHDKYTSAIIGSSNLTSSAIFGNYEWNLRLNSLSNAKITQELTFQIENEWNKAIPLTKEWYEAYKLEYKKIKKKNNLDHLNDYQIADQNIIEPNLMQKAALGEIANLRRKDINKALIISATGTGKTYLGAFDVKNFKPRRFLFVVHREQILEDALESFHKVIGGTKKEYGVFSGNDQSGIKAKYVFATSQTLSKDINLKQFAKDEFDYVMFDEAHHLGASQYLKIFNYFEPKFCLGMTATPERTDDFNIFKLFDYHIAYEIRLQDALENKMLAPFQYYGVEDYVYEDHVISDTSSLSDLVADERVDYIIEQTKYYGYSGDILHGLIFCSRNKEAEELAESLRQKGIQAKSLSGKDDVETRDEVVEELEKGKINYIVTVDIFNEGIDIPCINQIVLLRSTKSSIVFVQQLGRGLRKFPGKDYLTVIDFIGAYDNNYMIPMALSGDKSHNRDNLKDDLEVEPIYGVSVINFTHVAKERIYESINHSNLTVKRKLRNEYLNEKKKIGRIPMMADLQANSIDCQVIADKYKNYYKFLLEMGEEIPKLETYQEKVLTFLTVVLANGKRQHELLLLQELSKREKISKEDYSKILNKNNCYFDQKTSESIDCILSLSFFDGKALPNKESYGGRSLISNEDNFYQLDSVLKESLNNTFFKDLFVDALKTGILRSKRYNSNQSFTVGERYTRADACRLLNWKHIVSGQNIGGYRFDDNLKNCPIFVTYDKRKSHSINYPDHFISPSLMNIYSKTNRKLDSNEIAKFKDPDIDLHLFVKKSDDDGVSFIYLGECSSIENSFVQEYQKVINKKSLEEKTVPVVSFNLKLKIPVELNRYYMLTKLQY